MEATSAITYVIGIASESELPSTDAQMDSGNLIELAIAEKEIETVPASTTQTTNDDDNVQIVGENS